MNPFVQNDPLHKNPKSTFSLVYSQLFNFVW